MKDILEQANAQFNQMVAVRRDLHRHPELGFLEFRTASIVARELRELGYQVTENVAKTGVIGLVETGKPGPVVLMRFDMDALPIVEQTDAGYTSTTSGVMHACGHDGHVAIGLATARLLAGCKDELNGIIKFMFQPAEEGLGGAEKMIDAGILENPEVNYSLALHLWNNIPVGNLGLTAGPVMAGADIFSVKVHGKGGHGAMPDQSIDPILAASQIVSSLQSIVSRNIDPLKSAVISVTQFHSGDAFNVIPPLAELKGTIRTFDQDVRKKVVERFYDLVKNTAAALGCTADVEVEQIAPALVNEAKVTEVVRKVARQWFQDLQIMDPVRTMGSEDMAFVQQKVKGCYLFLGSANAEKGLVFGHHHPRFDFDETVLPQGAALMALSAMELLRVG